MDSKSFDDLAKAYPSATSRWGAEALGSPQERNADWSAHTTNFPAADHSAETARGWQAVSAPPEQATADYVEPTENLIMDGEKYVDDHSSAAWLDSTEHVADYEHAMEDAYDDYDALEAEDELEAQP